MNYLAKVKGENADHQTPLTTRPEAGKRIKWTPKRLIKDAVPNGRIQLAINLQNDS